MATAAGGGGRGGNRGGAPRGAQPGVQPNDALPAAVAAATPDANSPAAPAAAAAPAPLPEIGPDGPTDNVLYAWDPVARKERWRVAGGGAGAFAGGSLATAGNLVFSSVNDRLIAYRADTGEKLTEIQLGANQMGPPISFTIDGKQYIAVTAAPGGGGAGGPGAGRGAPAAAPRPANVLVLALDGKAQLPGAGATGN